MFKFPLFLILTMMTLNSQAAKLMILGDSLSAGYQMPLEQSWPVLLNQQWKQKGKHSIINASISGETSDGALRRLAQLLEIHKPNVVLIELGANDGLRGFAPQQTKQNLSEIIKKIHATQAKSILMQIRLPKNYGRRYLEMFEALYPQLAKEYELPMIEFLLEDIYFKPELMMADGIHPLPSTQKHIAERLNKQLSPLMTK